MAEDTHWKIHGRRYSLRDTWPKILIERYMAEDTHWEIHGRRYSLRDKWLKILIERYMAEDTHWEIHGRQTKTASHFNEVCEGYAFTGVCLSTGGSISRIQGGLHSRGVCIWGVRPLHRILRDTVKERAVHILLECKLIVDGLHGGSTYSGTQLMNYPDNVLLVPPFYLYLHQLEPLVVQSLVFSWNILSKDKSAI